MTLEKAIQGFSQLSREEKIRLAAEFAAHPVEFAREMFSHWHPELKSEEHYVEFTENSVSNYYLPYSLAPNFRIDGKDYIVPMVTEESSVVAAASAAAKFWWSRGGFVTHVNSRLKPGHIHFIWTGDPVVIRSFIEDIIPGLFASVASIEGSMKVRGGGVQSINLKSIGQKLPGYYQLEVLFDTVDAMGANFINSCLETMAGYMMHQAESKNLSESLEIIMAILSNYTPQCLVKCTVACDISNLELPGYVMSADVFVHRFEKAVLMAHHDVSRAVTHNKGIFNGVDAVIMATGNDFRAVEAGGHAWACKDGSYQALSEISIHQSRFEFSLELPMAVGVVGGLTSIHPLAKASLQLLGNPGADVLMSVAASAGMANHFSAIKALITGGIQRGHMKLHLVNILSQLNANPDEKEKASRYFRDRDVSFSAVKEFLSLMREM